MEKHFIIPSLIYNVNMPANMNYFTVLKLNKFIFITLLNFS